MYESLDNPSSLHFSANSISMYTRTPESCSEREMVALSQNNTLSCNTICTTQFSDGDTLLNSNSAGCDSLIDCRVGAGVPF